MRGSHTILSNPSNELSLLCDIIFVREQLPIDALCTAAKFGVKIASREPQNYGNDMVTQRQFIRRLGGFRFPSGGNQTASEGWASTPFVKMSGRPSTTLRTTSSAFMKYYTVLIDRGLSPLSSAQITTGSR